MPAPSAAAVVTLFRHWQRLLAEQRRIAADLASVEGQLAVLDLSVVANLESPLPPPPPPPPPIGTQRTLDQKIVLDHVRARGGVDYEQLAIELFGRSTSGDRLRANKRVQYLGSVGLLRKVGRRGWELGR